MLEQDGRWSMAPATGVYNDAVSNTLRRARARGTSDPSMERQVLSQSTPAIAAGSDVIPQLLASGQFLTQHDTGSSGGQYDPESRAAMEMMVWGSTPDNPPVYGYAAHGGVPNRDSMSYGDAHFMLKDRVKSRTTVTPGDSRGGHGVLPSLPWADVEAGRTPLTAHRPGLHGGAPPTRPWSRDTFNRYTEAQYHGGVSTDDIDHVVLTESARSPENIDRGTGYNPGYGWDPHPRFSEDLRDHEIPYRTERHIATSRQFSMANADPEDHPAWAPDRPEPIYANVDVYDPATHRTERDPEEMRERLMRGYRGR